ncbi:putative E3 ubiquitin-protein ligase HIP1 isoform X1 [Iris pallida]|uniref:RING-type E3 ubiquitin transferase n=1 Tax=Iris pallida TaxID=29817 RepID=A0AAX6IAN7_IRIPA|nr:putative E3 ubiquitin-protein ligase HIP1 isoform X1 [Iris pallida]
MQGQTSSIDSFPEKFEFDFRSSSSNNTAMDQEVYWNNMILTAETQNLPNYLLSPNDANIPYVSMSTQENAGLSIWTAGGPSSTEDSPNQGNHDENKVEHGWSTSQTDNASDGLRIEEGRFEAANLLSLENVNINLNSSEINDEQSFSQNPYWTDVPQIPEQNAAHVSIRNEDSETGPFTNPYKPGSSDVPSSSNPCGSSSEIVHFMSETSDRRPGSSLDGLRLGCKRKIIEGVPGPSSSSGSASFFRPSESNLQHSVSSGHNVNAAISISSPSCDLSGASSSEEQLNSRFGPVTRGNAPDCYPPASVAGNSDSSQRNFRPRINPAHQRDVFPSHIFSSRNTMRRSSIWTPNEASSELPFDQRIESRPTVASTSSQGQPHAAVIPRMPPHVCPLSWDGAPGSANGSSSSSINSGVGLMAMEEDANTWSVPRISIPEQPLFPPPPPPVMRHLVQDPTNRIVTNRSVGLVGNMDPSGAGTNRSVRTPAGLTWVPHQNTPQFSRSLVEVVRRTLLPSVGPESEGQSNNFALQRSAHSATSQEVVHRSGSSSRRNQPPVMRSSLLIDRQSDGVPLAMRREGRNRMLSEIRNVLDLMRRGEHVRFEDIFMLDHSVFRGAADLQDRHRDMRLDVDNMSYEELLALEERIGDVSTGLSEERISKCLKQRKHSSTTVTILVEPEPCCICQEEYMEGEDLGALDCGHDFHAACIKQWLTHKNLCPICKTTALVT